MCRFSAHFSWVSKSDHKRSCKNLAEKSGSHKVKKTYRMLCWSQAAFNCTMIYNIYCLIIVLFTLIRRCDCVQNMIFGHKMNKIHDK